MTVAQTKYHVRIEFLEAILGTVGKDPEVYTTYVQSKQVEAAAKTDITVTEDMLSEEADTIPEGDGLEQKGWTGFSTDEHGPFLYDYMIKGFFKEVCGSLRRVPKTKSAGIRAYKKIIDGLVFVEQRRLYLQFPDGEIPAKLDVLERPLRAQTMQGERVALARSDTAPAGTAIEFDLVIMGDEPDEATLREWFDYGKFKGLGQWRNARYGSFVYTMEAVA